MLKKGLLVAMLAMALYAMNIAPVSAALLSPPAAPDSVESPPPSGYVWSG